MTADQLRRLFELLKDYRDWLEDEPLRLALDDALTIVMSNVVGDELGMRGDHA